MVQWLRLHPSNTGVMGLIPDWGTKIPHAMWSSQKKRGGRNINLSIIEEGLAKENSSVFYLLFMGVSPQYHLPLLLTQLCILPALEQFFLLCV